MTADIVAALRGGHVGAMLSLFGTLVFFVAVPHGERRDALIRVASGSAALALLFGLAWFGMEAAALAQPDSMAALLAWVPAIALHTQFGRWLALRLLMLGVVLAMLRLRRGGPRSALLLTGAAVAMQPAFGHAGAMPGLQGNLLVVLEMLHLLAAGGWLGGLIPLWLVVRRLPPAEAATALRRFSCLALLCVTTIAASGFGLAMVLVGSLPPLVGTSYGRLILLKTGLFGIALLLAALNRLVLTRRVAAGDATARRTLLAAVRAETAVSFAIVMAAAVLAEGMPGMDAHPIAVPRALLWSAPAAALVAIAASVVIRAAAGCIGATRPGAPAR